MAEDFIELGIEGVDKLVDKHFHKLPDKYIDPHTYNIRERRRRKRHPESNDGDSLSEDEASRDPRHEDNTDYDDQRPRDPHYSHRQQDPRLNNQQDPYARDENGQGVHPPNSRYSETSRNAPYDARRDPYYSHQSNSGYPDRTRTSDYSNQPPRGYFAQGPPSFILGTGFDEYRGTPERRRDPMVRRSSSQPGTMSNDDRDRPREDRRRRRRGFSDERKSDKGSKSDSGIMKDKVVLGLLGAAAAGLAVSAVMGSGSDRKEHGSSSSGSSHRTRNNHGSHGTRDSGGRRVKGGGGRR